MIYRKPKRKLNIAIPKEEDGYSWRKGNKNIFAPAVTLGKPPEIDAQLAQDAVLSRFSSIIEHSLDLGQLPVAAGFMGYGVLQDIAQNGMIRACIQTVADDCTRTFGSVSIKNDELKKAEKINAAIERFGIKDLLHDVAETVGYFGGCLVYIDTDAEEHQRQLPLAIDDKSAELRNLKRFTVIDPINVYPGAYNSTDPLAPDFYKPEFWYVMSKKVHKSRLLRFVSNEVPILFKPAYNFFGIPQAQILWDYVAHFNNTRATIQELLNKYTMLVLKTGMQDALFGAGGLDNIEKRISLLSKYRNNNSVYAVDNTEELINIHTPIMGMTDILKQQLELIASINRTPAVKLLGISPAGFNATGQSDIRNYYDYIQSQRESLFNKGLAAIIDCIQAYLYGYIDKNARFEWDDLGVDDETQRTQLQGMNAQMLATLANANIINTEEAREFIVKQESDLSFIEPENAPQQPDADGSEQLLPEGVTPETKALV